MKGLKKAGAVMLALALAVPVAVAPEEVAKAAGKAPTLNMKSDSYLPDNEGELYVVKNKAKILKTTWKSSDKNVVSITKKSKKKVTFKTGSAGDTSAKITAKVKYKLGKKVKTKTLTCQIKLEWLKIDTARADSSLDGGNTELFIGFNYSTANINPYDETYTESVTYGEWTTSAKNVVEVTDVTDKTASGTAVEVKKVQDSDGRGRPTVRIDLGKVISQKTTYHVALMGYKGCGSKMIIETDVEVNPIEVKLTPVDYFNQEKKGDISLTLHTTKETPFSVAGLPYDENQTFMKVKGDDGKEIPITDIVVVTEPLADGTEFEGDGIVINLKGGAESKSFTIEFDNSFFAYYMKSEYMEAYCTPSNTIVIDKERIV